MPTEFLYLLRPKRLAMLTDGPTARESDIIAEHFAYLQELAQRGVMILVGRTLNNDEKTMGLAIFRANDEAAARNIMLGDPAVAKEIMTAELFPFRVALRDK